MWAFLGGFLGFGAEAPQTGQPVRSTPQIANQIRQLYATWVQGLEDAFYMKMYKDRMEKMVAQGQQPQGQQAVPQQQQSTPQQQQPASGSTIPRQLPGGTQGMSAQFLDAVAKVPGATLTDQQKRALDEARRASMSSTTGQPTPVPQQQVPTPGSNSMASVPPQAAQTQANQMANATSKSISAATMQSNPAIIYQWIKVREDAIRAKFRKYCLAYHCF